LKRILVDLNVVLDVALGRLAHVEASAALCSAIEAGGAIGLLPAHAYPTFFYVARKGVGSQQALQLVAELAQVFRVASIDDAVIARALTLGLSDFEDAVTAAAAEAAGCELIATRDPRGFLGSPVKAVTPELALTSFAGEVHEPMTPYDAAPVRRRRRRSHVAKRSTAASGR
jgi:predicted nucleic acid-binding protein